MSIHVFYQPIDVAVIQKSVFPYVWGNGEIERLLSRCEDPNAALSILQPFRGAYSALLAGSDYVDPQWGRCDPAEFIADNFVPAVLEFSRNIWPSWLVNAFTSRDLFPDQSPISEFYQDPASLFRPLEDYISETARSIEIIADPEQMVGVVPKDQVQSVLKVVAENHQQLTRDPNEPYAYDAMAELEAALIFASENDLSFTEAIE